MDYFKVESRKKDLNLFGVAKEPAECVVLPLVKSRNDLIGVLRKFLNVLIQVLEGNRSCCPLTMFLGRSIEKYQIGIHDFSKGLIIPKLRVIFTSGYLLILSFNFELLFCKLLANKYH